MSIKVDQGQSENARADGNVSFKKGKWVEAIGHYTTAIVSNPADPIAYTNRAAAYLKLEKFHDAERDCTSALSTPSGSSNVKALYRRSLARKALNQPKYALEDIDAVLKIESGNEAALTERKELVETIKVEEERREQKKKEKRVLPPSPPRTPPSALPIHATDTNGISASAASSSKSNEGGQISPKVQPATAAVDYTASTSGPPLGEKTSFASMRKGRSDAKKTFISSAAPPQPRPSIPEPRPPTTRSAELPTSQAPSASAAKPPIPTSSAPATPSTSARSDSTPSQPLSLTPIDPNQPGAALTLLRHLRAHSASPSLTFPLLTQLTTNYDIMLITKMLDGLLDPDFLGLLLGALYSGLPDSQSGQSNKGGADATVSEASRKMMTALRRTKRWEMNVMMLSTTERDWGSKIWAECGGDIEGDWRKADKS